MGDRQPPLWERRGLASAFTLIELLVCISIVALMLGILVPTLAQARRAARGAACVANIRSATMEIVSFADSHDGLVPSVPKWTDRNTQGSLLPHARISFPDGLYLQMTYFPGGRWWAAVMLADEQPAEAWTCLGYDQTDHLLTEYFYDGQPVFYAMGKPIPLSSYEMSEAFRAEPRFWRTGSPQSLTGLTAQRLEHVAFPSKKVLLYERVVIHEGDPPRSFWDGAGSVAMSDGSAGVRFARDALPGVINRLDAPGSVMRIRNTANGILGMDF